METRNYKIWSVFFNRNFFHKVFQTFFLSNFIDWYLSFLNHIWIFYYRVFIYFSLWIYNYIVFLHHRCEHDRHTLTRKLRWRDLLICHVWEIIFCSFPKKKISQISKKAPQVHTTSNKVVVYQLRSLKSTDLLDCNSQYKF